MEKNNRKARDAAIAAVKANCQNPKAWYELGRVESTHGNCDRALDCYERAVALDPLYDEAFQALVELEKQRMIGSPRSSSRSWTAILVLLVALGTLVMIGSVAVAWGSEQDLNLNEGRSYLALQAPDLERQGARGERYAFPVAPGEAWSPRLSIR